MRIFNVSDLSEDGLNDILKRPLIDSDKIFADVKNILDDVKVNGLKAALKYASRFDGFEKESIKISEQEFEIAEQRLAQKVKNAILFSKENIEKFHSIQVPNNYSIETQAGVNCSREFRAIENVGLYIPGGTAILPSTVLMLGIPAKLAGCKRIVAFSPSKNGEISDAVLFAAKVCGIDEFYKLGGAQAVALFGYGSTEVKKVDKIFGPGNQYVTAAKSLISIDPEGCAIDMPAGPSEVLVIADQNANPDFIASDLLSQAEHGIDSQVLLFSDSKSLIKSVSKKLIEQLEKLPRREIAEKALNNSFALKVSSIDEAIDLSNKYAPEHLILNFNDADSGLKKITNAGSVFVGSFTPESAGDYSSGTNHSLPTNGYTKVFGGVSVESFMKQITFQQISKEGLLNLADSIITLAEEEGLDGHANAVRIRLENGN